MKNIEHSTDNGEQTQDDQPLPQHYALIAGALLLFIVVFILVDVPGGDDWKTFSTSARQLIRPENLFSDRALVANKLYNPPWYLLLFLPILILPFKLGWAVGMALSIAGGLLLLNRWNPQPGYIKPFLLLLSPPMIYNFLHGQLDLLLLAGVMLPAEWWAVVATAKPQTAIGLVFGIKPSRWIRTAVVTAAVMGLCFLLFGNWLAFLLNKPYGQVGAGLNLWFGIWPFQVPAAVMMVVLGIQRDDERFFVASSPFFSPYASTGNLIGVWLAALTFLKDWQAVLVWLSWWGATLYRLLI